MVAPEITPWAKTGGLADVASGLSLALERLGFRVSLIMPAYHSLLQSDIASEEMGAMGFTVPVSDRQEVATVLKIRLKENVLAYFIRADKYFDRDYLYTTPEGDYPDNAERFVFFSRAALEVLRKNPPHILHCHDWQAAPAIVFLKTQPELYPECSSARTVFTVHNLGYQGAFWHLDWHLLNLDRQLFNSRCLEFYGKINFLKGGLVFTDAMTTVSPTYAEEIKTPEQGFGLEGVFQERTQDLVGILNGVDYDRWNPETDPVIAKNYSLKELAGKKACKADLQRVFGLPDEPDVPLFGMISRLASQKGFDLLEKAFDELLSRELQLVFLGSGERKYEELLKELATRYPGRVGLRIGFDEALAHKIEAGADLFLMPSLYEPCGLNQIYSLKYGTIPIVRATGGLKDTVHDYNTHRGGTGFVFGPYEPSALLEAADRALKLFPQKRQWTALVQRAMAADFSWNRSARSYSELYQKLVL